MTHFAHINEQNIVDQVIVAEQDFISSGAVGDPNTWIQTSYNTRGGVHYNSETNEPDGGIPLRKNYAGIGYTYDSVRDAFIPQKPFESWILNENSCLWEAPIAYPIDGKTYFWNEEIVNWEEITEGVV